MPPFFPVSGTASPNFHPLLTIFGQARRLPRYAGGSRSPELIILHHPGAFDQSVYHLSLRLKRRARAMDDTVWASGSHGVILVSDRDAETIYAISKDIFSPGAAYSATPASGGRLNRDNGVITNVVTGRVSPRGMAVVKERE
jgi:hypothetical protein